MRISCPWRGGILTRILSLVPISCTKVCVRSTQASGGPYLQCLMEPLLLHYLNLFIIILGEVKLAGFTTRREIGVFIHQKWKEGCQILPWTCVDIANTHNNALYLCMIGELNEHFYLPMSLTS